MQSTKQDVENLFHKHKSEQELLDSIVQLIQSKDKSPERLLEIFAHSIDKLVNKNYSIKRIVKLACNPKYKNTFSEAKDEATTK